MELGKKEWISNLRVTATIGVILLHVASSALYKYNQVPNSEWWTGNILDSLVRFSVPIFLMITGALVLGKQTSYPIFIKKKIVRILLPFAFWTGIYIIYNFIEPPQFFGKTESQTNLDWILQQIKDGSSYHLWYIYMLLGIYLIIPALNLLISRIHKRYIELFLLFWFVVLIFKSTDTSESNFEWNFWYYLGYLGYVLLGFYMSTLKTNYKKINLIVLATFLIGLSITALGTYYGTKPNGTFYKYYYSYLTPNVLLMSISIFILFKNQNNKLKGLLLSVRNLLDKHSYGIYLSHILVLNYLIMHGIDWDLYNPLIGIPLTTIITLSISVTIVFLINKIPFGKYISG